MFKIMKKIEIKKIEPVSMIDQNEKQRVNIEYYAAEDFRGTVEIYNGERLITCERTGLLSGENKIYLMIPAAQSDFRAVISLTCDNGEKVAEKEFEWKKPIKREIYIVVSSHTDIGLHNSQYIQRYNSERFIDEAAKLIDETEAEKDAEPYRYTIEGTWFWNNYPADRGEKAAKRISEEYIKRGKMGICGGVAGNHTHVYGAEELCRSVYPRRELEKQWGIKTDTISMIDNNGLSWSIIQPYAEVGVKNIFFSPNQWNPIPSTVWNCDKDVPGYTWNSEAGGGGARIDVRYSSELPMLFWWQAAGGNEQKLLVWSSLQYDNGSKIFGFNHRYECSEETLRRMEKSFSERLPQLDKKYPYRIWLMADYGDDQIPDLKLWETLKEWNKRWAYPKLKISGNIDEPFEIIRKEYGDEIPVLKGDITGGWYQHPLSTADLTARKLNADRRLVTAEKACTVATLSEKKFEYPKEKFDRAWNELLMNDEHSYGASGYIGRRVFETWLQHRVWVENVERYAAENLKDAFEAECENDEDYITLFNPSAHERNEVISYHGDEYVTGNLPPLKFTSIKKSEKVIERIDAQDVSAAPIIENKYYRVEFSQNGAIKSLYDKELQKEIVDKSVNHGINEFIYTKDNHMTFSTADEAKFKVKECSHYTEIIATSTEKQSGASLEFTMRIHHLEKKIEFDDKIYHAKDMFNNDRWKRYVYISFPVFVQNARRYTYLNGVEAEYAKDITGHGTDVYAACNEWCCSENEEYGAGLVMRDSQLIEFDHIHPDKTDFGNVGGGSAMYAYVANDWLQRHVSGGNYINFRFRYLLTTYRGNRETAKLNEKAEDFVNDIEVYGGKQKTALSHGTEVKVKGASRIIGMKISETCDGVVVRTSGDSDAEVYLNGKIGKRVSIDETPLTAENSEMKGQGICTHLFKGYEFSTRKENNTLNTKAGKLSPIGSVYTGLINKPRATCGEKRGQLYLLWGQNIEESLNHYELYRSEARDFKLDETTHIANVLPGEYRCARYEDLGLQDDKEYYYIVRAVGKNGEKSEFSAKFSGKTRALIDGKEQKLSDLSGRATSESKE